MTLHRIFRQIESDEFSLELGLSGSLNRAMTALTRNPRVIELRDVMTNNSTAVHEAATRIMTLLRKKIDLRFTHPDDAAIAAYLMAFNMLSHELGPALRHMVTKHHWNLWWSARIVDDSKMLRGPVRAEITADSVNIEKEGDLLITHSDTEVMTAPLFFSGGLFIPINIKITSVKMDYPPYSQTVSCHTSNHEVAA